MCTHWLLVQLTWWRAQRRRAWMCLASSRGRWAGCRDLMPAVRKRRGTIRTETPLRWRFENSFSDEYNPHRAVLCTRCLQPRRWRPRVNILCRFYTQQKSFGWDCKPRCPCKKCMGWLCNSVLLRVESSRHWHRFDCPVWQGIFLP